MNKLEKFTLLVDELKRLKESIEDKKLNESKMPLINFERVIEELKNAKQKVLPDRKKEVEELLKTNPLKISAFELMEYKFHENSHSNILQYLFDYNLFNDKNAQEDGADVLCAFIDKTPDLANKEDFRNQIYKRKYRVDREKSVDGGRMDIFISDSEMAIVIENKIYASVGKNEDEKGVPISQLQKYQKFILKNYKDHKHAFILLSFKDRNKEENYNPFIFVDYDLLYDVLKNFKSDDNILNDYKILLRSLVNNISDKEWLINQTRNIDELDNLYDLQQIKNLSYGN